jgi:hypothetical protein
MGLMTTPRKPKKSDDKPPESSAKKPNRVGKSLHCYIDPVLRTTLDELSDSLDVDLTALTETALRLLFHEMGMGERPVKRWLPAHTPPPDQE